VAVLIGLLYAFLVSIGLLSKAFKLLGGGFVDGIITSASNPLVGLFVGILATTLVQSSSTTTSIVVALVGSGAMPASTAIPVIMGANIGTSVTNTLVSLAHVTRGREYYRAISASTVHDFFNIFAVIIIFPLQYATHYLSTVSLALARAFQNIGGLTFTSPLKLLTAPAVHLLADALQDYPWMILVVAIGLMFGSLRYMVTTLKSLVLTRVEGIFDVVLFKTAGRAFLFGLFLTVLVQSSSITTSLVVPLAGAGLLRLEQIFPYTLGANVGTTITAILAALAVGEVSALSVAFAHLLFNVSGIAFIWPLKSIRRIPVATAVRLAELSERNRWLPMVYIAVVFFLLPLTLILILR
jgi:sodium-dependent phosphate cotransporter